MWTAVAITYHLASRLAYVIGVGVALTQQDRRQAFTRLHGVEPGFRRFRRLAAILMNNDAVSFVLLCLVTRETIPSGLPVLVLPGVGLLCIFIGIATKLWAAARIGRSAYYWHNFFVPVSPVPLDPPGPYRYLKNPMYTVGYLHAYGFAMLVGSSAGLMLAAFDQLAILVFLAMVEKPHFARLTSLDIKPSPPHLAPR
jgi:protein-S-isoprenylcysteine O-methyltransferase Ste14